MLHDFDPYEMLLELQAKLDNLEVCHNNLVRDYEYTKHRLDQTIANVRQMRAERIADQYLLIDKKVE